MECQRVKFEHRHSTRLLQPTPKPKWKYEVVIIDFITKLSKITKQHDFIMVVMDKLMKNANFAPIKSTRESTNITKINMKEIARLHGIPKVIVLDKDLKFIANFWK